MIKVLALLPPSPVFDWMAAHLQHTARAVASEIYLRVWRWGADDATTRIDDIFNMILDWTSDETLFERVTVPIHHVFVEAWPAQSEDQITHNKRVLALPYDSFIVHSPVLCTALAHCGGRSPDLWILGTHEPVNPRNIPKTYDVAHYGSDLGARSGFLTRLRPHLDRHGISFRDLSGSFGGTLMHELDDARIIINVEHTPQVQTFSTWRFWQAVEAGALLVNQMVGFASTWPADENMVRTVVSGDAELFAQVLADILAPSGEDLWTARTCAAHAFGRSFPPAHNFRDLLARMGYL